MATTLPASRGGRISVTQRNDGRFDSLFIITNRARFRRDGTFYPASGYNRGRLRFGRSSESTLADWYYEPEAALLELRLPWGLINVTDPSTSTHHSRCRCQTVQSRRLEQMDSGSA